jgi:hypothetical protein
MEDEVQCLSAILRNLDMNVRAQFTECFFEQTDISRVVFDKKDFDRSMRISEKHYHGRERPLIVTA